MIFHIINETILKQNRGLASSFRLGVSYRSQSSMYAMIR